MNNMESLDDILTKQSRSEFEAQIANLFDPNGWTKENRDGRLEDVSELVKEMASNTESFVRDALESQEDGHSILWWKIYQQFLIGQYGFLQEIRTAIDEVTDEGLRELQIDYDWMNQKIRELRKEIEDVSNKVGPMFEIEDATEEV